MLMSRIISEVVQLDCLDTVMGEHGVGTGGNGLVMEPRRNCGFRIVCWGDAPGARVRGHHEMRRRSSPC